MCKKVFHCKSIYADMKIWVLSNLIIWLLKDKLGRVIFGLGAWVFAKRWSSLHTQTGAVAKAQISFRHAFAANYEKAATSSNQRQ